MPSEIAMLKFLCYLLLVLFISPPAMAQTASLHGQITDQTGAIIPGASVTLSGPPGSTKTATTAADGTYTFTGLVPGDYTVQVSAPDLVLLQPAKVTLGPGIGTLNLQLEVAPTTQQVNVEDIATTVTPEPSNNASALVLRGTDLQALSDDPTDLQSDLQALAGPSAGPSGNQVYVDGFSNGELPSKDAIREVRVNQNPFSPEYDKLGLGRIEILTKPGSDKWRGSLFHNFGDDFWNSRNAYSDQKAPFLLREYGGSFGGPFNRRSSFFVDVRRDATDNGSIIDAIVLDPTTFSITPFTDVYRVKQRGVRISPRLDYQLNSNHTLSFRYGFSQADVPGAGVGGFNLVEGGYDHLTTSHTAQITETAVLNPRVVNEVRFQFFHIVTRDTANFQTAAIQVLGSFNGGAATLGHALDRLNNYELQESVSVTEGRHSWRFGVRLRGQTEGSTLPDNFGGTFTFGGGVAPELDANNNPVLDSSGQPVLVSISSIEQYRRTVLFRNSGYSPAEIQTLGGGATQFSIVAGNPALSASRFDLGAFVGDDWRVDPRFTLSLGLRYEGQTNIHDWRDFAPRIGLAWVPGKGTPGSESKTVLRAGFGIFYDRFSLSNTLISQRYNGIVQQQYLIANPDFFPSIPAVGSLSSSQSQIWRVSSVLRAPYLMQSLFSVEQQLPLHTTLAVTYAHSHGLHELRSQDINAPLPGTFQPNIPGSGVYPLGTPGAVFLMESSGLYNQDQFIVNVNARVNRNVSLNGNYMLSRARSNTDGINTFPAHPYNLTGEYGPAATDVRQRLLLTGTLATKWNVQLNPFVILQSGLPFNITLGQDLYGTTLFNGRPGFTTDPNKPGVIKTQYGLLDPDPTSEEKILPRNYGRGPGSILVNLRISKTINFGPREASSSSKAGAGGGQSTSPGRYNLVISMSIRNIINHNNPGPIIGNITSPLFGQANQPAGGGGFGVGGNPGGVSLGGGGFLESANNRRLELQVRFNF